MIEKIKPSISVIFQDKETKKISTVKSFRKESIDTLFESDNLNFIDCDLDSILCVGNFQIPSLKKITAPENLSFSGLLPVVAVDLENKVLMQAFLNLEAISNSFTTGFANYFSRSRNKIWLKGESSDHKQEIVNIEYSEKDSFFVYSVNQNVAACHEGYYSCFYRKLGIDGNLSEIDFNRKFKPERIYGK